MVMAEPVLRRSLDLQQRIVNPLYPIAVRYNATLPKCFMQLKEYQSSRSWEGTLKLKDMRAPSQKVPAVLNIIADQPIPLCCSLYYYEVNISAKSQCGSLKVGFSFDESDKTKHQRCVNFIGYHSNTGRICLNDGFSLSGGEEDDVCGPSFGAGDVIGCGVNFVNKSLFFTKNGIIVGNSSVQNKLTSGVTIPCVIMISPATALIANFGQRDFVFAIDQFLAQERCNAVTQAIESKLTADLANVGMQSLVFDYLLRHGYLDTANAMARPSVVSSTSNVAITPTVNSHTAAAAVPLSPSFPSENGIRDKEDVESTSTPQPPQPNDFQYSLSPKLKRWAKKWSLKDLFKNSQSSTPLHRRKAKQESLESPMTEVEDKSTVEGVSASTTSAGIPKPTPLKEGWECGGGERWPETPGAANQRIRLAEMISQGQYLQAISHLVHDYSGLVESMPSIIFMLRCRYFIELLFTNQSPKECDVSQAMVKTVPTAATQTKATSAPPNPDCRKGGKTGGTGTYKRPQPSSSPECSPCGGGGGGGSRGCFRQSAAVRRKCEEINGIINGASEDDDEIPVEYIRHENGTVAVLQALRCNHNGVSTLVKEKKKAIKSLFKSSSLNSVEKASEIPTQNGVTRQNICESSEIPSESTPRLTPAAKTLIKGSSVTSLDLNGIVQLGRELRDKARELQANNVLSPALHSLLQDAFSLIAYENPYESPFADLMHPRHRINLAESVNNAILVNLGKARYPLLEIGIGMLEETVLDGQGMRPVNSDTTDAKSIRKQHNQASTSSAGSTLTPSQTVSTSVNLPSTVSIYATATTASSPSPRTGGSGLQQYHRSHRRHHHRSATSSLVVTSTTTTSASTTASRAPNPLLFLANLPPPSVSFRQRSSSSSTGRRLRNTIVQSSPRDAGEEGLQEIVVSGGGGVDWIEGAPEREDEPEAGAAGTTMDEVEYVQVIFQEGGGIRMDRYVPPPLPPLPNVDVRRGGSEMAGFFHPVLFVPPPPPT